MLEDKTLTNKVSWMRGTKRVREREETEREKEMEEREEEVVRKDEI